MKIVSKSLKYSFSSFLSGYLAVSISKVGLSSLRSESTYQLSNSDFKFKSSTSSSFSVLSLSRVQQLQQACSSSTGEKLQSYNHVGDRQHQPLNNPSNLPTFGSVIMLEIRFSINLSTTLSTFIKTTKAQPPPVQMHQHLNNFQGKESESESCS